jgi:hypothetical protein
MIILDLERIGLERIRLAAADHVRLIRLHQGLEPLADGGGRIGPLAVVAGGGGCDHGESRKGGEREFHPMAPIYRRIPTVRKFGRMTRAAICRCLYSLPSWPKFLSDRSVLPEREWYQLVIVTLMRIKQCAEYTAGREAGR